MVFGRPVNALQIFPPSSPVSGITPATLFKGMFCKLAEKYGTGTFARVND